MLHLWPHKIRGEGHFIALLQKNIDSDKFASAYGTLPAPDQRSLPPVKSFMDELGYELMPNALFGNQLTLIPAIIPDLKGIKVLRAGFHVGELKGKNFVPNHALALAERSKKEIALTEAEAAAYIHGDAIPYNGTLKGYCTVSLQGYTLGFGKISDDLIKNHYPKGLRR